MLLALLAPAILVQDTSLAAQRHNLMPVPRSVSWSAGRFAVDSTFTVSSTGARDARLDHAILRFISRLEARTAKPMSHAIGRDGAARLVITASGPGMAVQGVAEDESYALVVNAGGITLRAPTTVGALRGLETLLQLVESDSSGHFLPAVSIDDAPRFPWRGLLVDAGRHFMPPDVVRRTLDGMAAVKLNVLHWHLSEDQGFRVESKRFPRLQQLGSDGQFYTQAEVREIVAYARDRGIRVVPEFDMPGHSTSWLVGYPRYGSGAGPYDIERHFGVFDPTFDPTNEALYTFLDGFIGEMRPLFPDAYWHVGGDEVSGVEWRTNPRIQAFMTRRHLANNDALQTYFNQRLLRIVTKYHKKMIGWDEILTPELPKDAMIQSWRGTASLARAAQGGYSGILSSGYYLDHQSSAEFHYGYDPLPANTTLTPEEQSRVLGGEACMWAEHVTPETVDSRIWPRLAAIAERLWSPREVAQVDDMYRRLRVTSARLEELGLGHEAHTGRMLRRVAGADAPLLANIMELVQPITFDDRSHIQPLTSLTPLDFLVDAARPDPPSRWQAVRLAQRFLASPADTAARSGIGTMIAASRSEALRIQRHGATSPAFAQAMPVAIAMDSVAAKGQEALRFLALAERADSAWTATSLASLQRWGRPQGLLRVAIVDAVRVLVRAAGGVADSAGGRR